MVVAKIIKAWKSFQTVLCISLLVILAGESLPTHHQHHEHDGTTSHIFQLAHNASGGFFSDISNKNWLLKSTIHCEDSTPDLQEGNIMSESAAEYWNMLKLYWNNFFFVTHEPTFECGFKRKLGSRADGGKWVCDPHRIKRGKGSCLTYSIGSNNQFDFEEALDKHLGGCEIHTFDPTIEGTKADAKITTYHKTGISSQADANNKTFFTIGQTIDSLGHANRVIDIFKIDCEGCEYSLFTHEFFQALDSRGVKLRQILVELHPYSSFKNQIGSKEQFLVATNFFKLLRERGYVIFHKEPNNLSGNCGRFIEYSFLLVEGLDCAKFQSQSSVSTILT